MKKFFDQLFSKLTCHHEWELIHRTHIIDDFCDYYRYTYVCKKCGKFKTMK